MRVVVSECAGVVLVSCCMFVSCVQPVSIRSAVFCTVCSLCMLVVEAMGDHIVEAYSSKGLVMALYVESIVFLCLSHLVDLEYW